jgi:hypothetical protein
MKRGWRKSYHGDILHQPGEEEAAAGRRVGYEDICEEACGEKEKLKRRLRSGVEEGYGSNLKISEIGVSLLSRAKKKVKYNQSYLA